VESDLSVFHRIEDPMALPGPRLMKLAERLPAYRGALAHRLRTDRDRADSEELEELKKLFAPPPDAAGPDSILNPPAAQGGGAGQPISKHSYTEIPEILLPGPQIDGATVVPANRAALAVSDLGHLFSFSTAG
jgi:hypothetical protein